MKKNENISNIAFLNLALTLTKSFLILMIIFFTFLVIEDKSKKTIEKKAEILIELSWEENSLDDLDLFLFTSNKEVIFYANRESLNGNIILERDNRGFNNKENISERSEILSFKTYENGIFNISVLLYDIEDSQNIKVGDLLLKPISFNVRMIKLNPNFEVIYSKKFSFYRFREEIRIFSFEIKDNNIYIMNLDFDSIVGRVYPYNEFYSN